jgi:hypothetical protein
LQVQVLLHGAVVPQSSVQHIATRFDPLLQSGELT